MDQLMRLQFGTSGGDVATTPTGSPAAGSAWLVFDAPISGTQISTLYQRGTSTAWPGGIVTADSDGRILFDLDADVRVSVWMSQSTTGPRWEMRPSGEPLALPAGGALGEVLRTGTDGPEWAPLPSVGGGGGSGNTVSAAHLATWSVNAAGKKLISDGSRYDSFPVATARDDGTLVVAWSSNATHAGDGFVKLSRSTNQGATWTSPQMVGGDPADGRSQIVALSSLRDRTAMLTFTDGAPARTGWLWVTNDPASWPSLGTKVDWGTVGSVFPSSLVWLDDGTTDGVMLATEYGTEGIIVAKSLDAGLSWQRLSTPLPPGQGWNETAISRTAAGDLIMLARNNGATDRIDILRSYDGGTTWTEPRVAVATASGMPKVTLMPDGTLIGTIRDELQSDGRWTLIVSSDNGHHWTRMPVNDEWMMYGQIVPLVNGDALLVGANQNRAVTDQAWVWTMPLTLAAGAGDTGWVDDLTAETGFSLTDSGSVRYPKVGWRIRNGQMSFIARFRATTAGTFPADTVTKVATSSGFRPDPYAILAFRRTGGGQAAGFGTISPSTGAIYVQPTTAITYSAGHEFAMTLTPYWIN